MKLQRIIKSGKKIKLALSIPESDLNLLREYAKFYSITYEEEIKDTELALHIIKDYLESDKAFMSYLAKVTEATNSESIKSSKKKVA